MSASGALVKSIRSVVALTFFEQVAAPIQVVPRRLDAWAAFEDGASLIGAVALARLSGSTFWAHVAVTPERRCLGIGGELLYIATREASEGGGRRLIGSHPARAIEPRMLVETQPLQSARRVKEGKAEVVLFIPESPARTPGGQT